MPEALRNAEMLFKPEAFRELENFLRYRKYVSTLRNVYEDAKL